MMGHCGFGVSECDNGGFIPTIFIDVGGRIFTFECDHMFKDEPSGRDFILGVYKILTGEKKNLIYSPEGVKQGGKENGH